MTRALLALSLALAAGCYTEADVGTGYGYAAPEADLVVVSPGVQVVADYDYPVFFSDGFYWRSYGGAWYRSPYRDRGWVVNYNVPMGVRGISRPEAYVHYHGNAGFRGDGGYRGAPATYRGNAGGGAVVREHGEAAPARAYHPAGAGARGPVVREHRR